MAAIKTKISAMENGLLATRAPHSITVLRGRGININAINSTARLTKTIMALRELPLVAELACLIASWLFDCCLGAVTTPVSIQIVGVLDRQHPLSPIGRTSLQ